MRRLVAEVEGEVADLAAEVVVAAAATLAADAVAVAAKLGGEMEVAGNHNHRRHQTIVIELEEPGTEVAPQEEAVAVVAAPDVNEAVVVVAAAEPPRNKSENSK